MIDDLFDVFAHVTERNLRPLRDHQRRAIEAIDASIDAGKRRIVLQGPCGFGKTLTSAHIIDRALSERKRVIFSVPFLSLIDQTYEAFQAEGLTCVGVVQGDHPNTDPYQPVQICSLQTLGRRKYLPPADLVIVDECHRIFKSLNQWLTDPTWLHVPFIGLSATPWARGMAKYWDDLIIGATTQELIDGKFLSPFVVYSHRAPDLSDVKVVAGEYQQDQLADACDKVELLGDIVDTWLKRGGSHPTIAFAVNRRHAENLAAQFNEAGVPAAYLDCFTKRDDRLKIFKAFKAGEIRVLCNVGVLSTGFDGDVRCIIDAHPTRSEILLVQSYGRGLRTAYGKHNCIILDHAGNALRHGLITDIHHVELDQGDRQYPQSQKKDKAEPRIRLCEECRAVLPVGTRTCTECGHEHAPKHEVVSRDGQLVELGSKISEAVRHSALERRQFFGELLGIAGERGYAEGWAAYKYREKFGQWPDRSMQRHTEPIEPTIRTRQWVRSRNIAFAKGRAAHG